MSIEIDKVRPLGHRILVRRYRKPEKVGSIILPDSVRDDFTLSLWEFVKAAPAALKFLGYDLQPDDIIQTRPMRGVFLGDDFHALIDAREVIGVIPW